MIDISNPDNIMNTEVCWVGTNGEIIIGHVIAINFTNHDHSMRIEAYFAKSEITVQPKCMVEGDKLILLSVWNKENLVTFNNRLYKSLDDLYLDYI